MRGRLPKMMEEARNLSIAGLVLLCVVTIAAFFGTWHPYLDWFSHFRASYVGLALFPLVVLGSERRRIAWAAVAVMVVNGAVLAPWLGSGSSADVEGCESAASALAINAFGNNSDHDALMAQIEAEDPEIVFISELPSDLKDRVAELYPHHVWRARFGRIGLFSKYPVEEGGYVLAPDGRPTINAVVSTPNGSLRVVGAHPTCPAGTEQSVNRNAMLRQIADIARTSIEPTVVVGDLNVTMYSPHYAPLKEAGLRNARLGRGLYATWPSGSPVRIPIDHVLTSSELSVCELEVGPSFESDHLPLRASFRWTQPAPSAIALR